MSFAAYVDATYQATLMTAEEERAYERDHECHRKDCDAAVESTVKCEGCLKYFCGLHLHDGLCAPCFVIDEAADSLLDELRAA